MSGYGLIGTGADYRQQAAQGLQQAAEQETDRNIQNKQIKQQAKAANQQLGAAGGAMAGFMIGGPVGAVIGGLGGAILGGLF
jgi:hypothetical protein